jgi:hypothetical protein
MRKIILPLAALLSALADPAAAGCAGDYVIAYPISSEHLAEGTRWTALLKALDHYRVPRTFAGNLDYQEYGAAERTANDSLKAYLRRSGLDSLAGMDWSRYRCMGSGTRITNHSVTVLDFLKAISSDPVAQRQFHDLASARFRIFLELSCGRDKNLPALLPDLRRIADNPGSGDWGRYLYASALFYADSLSEAMQEAEPLKASRFRWVAEAAWILRARAAMIAAQKDWDGWSPPPGNLDTGMLALSAREYAGYLAGFPDGRYRHSAHGMRRRMFFLTGNRAAFNRAVVEDFESCLAAGAGPGCPIQPIALDASLHYDDSLDLPVSSPLLMVYFARTRKAHRWENVLARLEEAKPAYAKYPGLHDYILATILRQKGDHAGLVADYGNRPPSGDLPARALAVAVGRSLEDGKLWKQAVAHWSRLAKSVPDSNDYIQKHLANAYLQAGDAPGALDTASQMRDTAALIEAAYWSGEDSCILSWAKSPNLKAAARRALSRRILNRHLYKGRYREFADFYDSLAPDDRRYHDSAIAAVRQLAENPRDPSGLFGLGNFLWKWKDIKADYRILEDGQYFRDTYDMPRGHEPDRPCCRGQGSADGYTYSSERVGRPTPFSLFLRASLEYPEGEKHAEEAMVLRSLILCYSNTNIGIACKADENRPLEDRRRWFKKLFRKYPDSESARKTGIFY